MVMLHFPCTCSAFTKRLHWPALVPELMATADYQIDRHAPFTPELMATAAYQIYTHVLRMYYACATRVL